VDNLLTTYRSIDCMTSNIEGSIPRYSLRGSLSVHTNSNSSSLHYDLFPLGHTRDGAYGIGPPRSVVERKRSDEGTK
jgi:hypothetical protein